MPIQSLNSVEKDGFFRGLLIGRPGNGKTIAAGGWPGKTLVFDADNRATPLLDFYPERKGEIDRLVLTAGNYRESVDVVNSQIIKPVYQNYIFDGITAFSTLLIIMMMNAKGEGVGKITKSGIAVPSWDEFNGEAIILSQFLEALKSIKGNVFVTGHPVKKTDMKGEVTESIISFGTKVPSMVYGYFDNVFYFDYEFAVMGTNTNIKRIVRTSPSATYKEAKCAYTKVPDVIDITSPARTYKPGFGLYDKIKEFI